MEVVFATTTPAIGENANWTCRSNSQIDDYNRIAREVLVPHEVHTNKLSDFVQKKCEALLHARIHFLIEGSAMLADEIIHSF